jgi:hypothetical protein
LAFLVSLEFSFVGWMEPQAQSDNSTHTMRSIANQRTAAQGPVIDVIEQPALPRTRLATGKLDRINVVFYPEVSEHKNNALASSRRLSRNSTQKPAAAPGSYETENQCPECVRRCG